MAGQLLKANTKLSRSGDRAAMGSDARWAIVIRPCIYCISTCQYVPSGPTVSVALHCLVCILFHVLLLLGDVLTSGESRLRCLPSLCRPSYSFKPYWLIAPATASIQDISPVTSASVKARLIRHFNSRPAGLNKPVACALGPKILDDILGHCCLACHAALTSHGGVDRLLEDGSNRVPVDDGYVGSVKIDVK